MVVKKKIFVWQRFRWEPACLGDLESANLRAKKIIFSRELDTKNAGMPAFSYHIGKPG
jgi:hypothetical protein